MVVEYLLYLLCFWQLIASRVWMFGERDSQRCFGKRQEGLSNHKVEEEYLRVWGRTIYYHLFVLFDSCSLPTWSQAPWFLLCPSPHPPQGLMPPSLQCHTSPRAFSEPCHLEQPPLISELRWLAPFLISLEDLPLLLGLRSVNLFLLLLLHW